MIINNLEEIIKLLKFDDLDTFYYLQILQRKKDNPSLLSDKKIYRRFITSLDDLNNILDDIKFLCQSYSARAYISLAPRSNEKFAKECLKQITDKVCSNLYSGIYAIPDKVALSSNVVKNKVWILDVDNDIDYLTEIMRSIKESTLGVLPTPNGFHIVVNPFDLRRDGLKYFGNDNYSINNYCFTLRKEALTILYA